MTSETQNVSSVNKHSEDFIKAKKLYYLEKYEVNEVEINIKQNEKKETAATARISFSKGSDVLTINSSKPDFLQLAFSLKTTIRDGKKKLVEVRNTSSYYENIKYFISAEEEPVKEAIKRIQQGRSNLPKGFVLQDVFQLIVDGRFKEPQIKSLMENYFDGLAIMILHLTFLYENFEKAKSKSRDQTRFLELFNLSGRIFQNYLFTMPPLTAIEFYLKNSKLDVEHAAKGLSFQNESTLTKWMALTDRGKKGVDGRLGAKLLSDDYRDFYEIAKKMLRNLTVIIAHSQGKTISSDEEIEEILRSNGYERLLNCIDPAIRNCGSHWDVDYTELDKVKLLDTRSGRAVVIGEITLNQLAEKANGIKELALILLLSILMCEGLLYLRCLDSPDLKFKLVEAVG